MIRAILRWLFKKEYAEAKALIESAKALPVRYVKYETYGIDTIQFLDPMQEIIKSTQFKFWLFERKAEYDKLIKYGTVANREMNIGRSMAIDELLADCVSFDTKYREILAEQATNAKV